MANLMGRLPVREDVDTVTYRRQPTQAEINRGWGCLYHRDFPVAVCCHTGTRIPKRWFIAPDDGLRYYR